MAEQVNHQGYHERARSGAWSCWAQREELREKGERLTMLALAHACLQADPSMTHIELYDDEEGGARFTKGSNAEREFYIVDEGDGDDVECPDLDEDLISGLCMDFNSASASGWDFTESINPQIYTDGHGVRHEMPSGEFRIDLRKCVEILTEYEFPHEPVPQDLQDIEAIERWLAEKE